jgi:hypothetical protein
LSLPTGNPNLRDPNGNIDPGKSTGFGKPSYSIGATATKQLSPRWTFNLELSYLGFQAYNYADGNRVKFGSEYRANAAAIYRLYTDVERKLRVDLSMELPYLHLGRDQTNGMGDVATGGDILYALPGVRLYWDRFNRFSGSVWRSA